MVEHGVNAAISFRCKASFFYESRVFPEKVGSPFFASLSRSGSVRRGSTGFDADQPVSLVTSRTVKVTRPISEQPEFQKSLPPNFRSVGISLDRCLPRYLIASTEKF
jgi:hypothetical protein